MLKLAAFVFFVCLIASDFAAAQAPTPGSRPAGRLLGQIASIDQANKTMTVKEDQGSSEVTVSLTATKSFLKVPPGEKDLTKASRVDITALSVGDRVAVRGNKPDGATAFEASVVLLMTAGELQQKHQAEQTAWQQRGMAGTVVTVTPASRLVTVRARGPQGLQPVQVHVPDSAVIRRYASDSLTFGKAKASTLDELSAGDQIQVLRASQEADAAPVGEKPVEAEQIISGAFRTIAGKVSAVSTDGSELDMVDNQSKKPLKAVFSSETSVHQMTPQMAQTLVSGSRRSQSAPGATNAPAAEPAAATGRASRGLDLSKIIEQLPVGKPQDIKAGDTVLAYAGVDKATGKLTLLKLVSGVEPLLAAPRSAQGSSSGTGDWNLDLGDSGPMAGQQ